MMPKRLALTENEQEFAQITKALQESRKPTRAKPSLWFVSFMVMLMLVCLGLGTWQLNRLEQKLTLISRVEARISAEPISLPPAAEWSAFDVEIYDFQPVQLSGTYVPDQTILVFTKLADPVGPKSGVGYWVVTPLVLNTGGTVFVNRGFIPEATKDLFSPLGLGQTPTGVQSIAGIARTSEAENTFTPGPDTAKRIDYVRNIDRLTAMVPIGLAPIAPVYVNANATEPDTLPQGGETKIDFPNRHMEYAITWFSLAGVILVMTGIWLWHRSRA